MTRIGMNQHSANTLASLVPWTPMGQAFEGGQMMGEGYTSGNQTQGALGAGWAALAALPFGISSRRALVPQMERARRLGFNTDEVLYHGTPYGPFREFDLRRAGSASGEEGERAIFLTPNRSLASDFATQFTAEGPSAPRVMPLYIRPGRQLTLGPRDLPEVAQRDWSLLGVFGRRHLGYNNDVFRGALDRARAAGYDSVRFRRVGEFDRAPSDQVAVLDPRNVRSAVADFHPGRIDSANLLAGLAPPLTVGAGLAWWQTPPDQR
jgi:hypothetical protein